MGRCGAGRGVQQALACYLHAQRLWCPSNASLTARSVPRVVRCRVISGDSNSPARPCHSALGVLAVPATRLLTCVMLPCQVHTHLCNEVGEAEEHPIINEFHAFCFCYWDYKLRCFEGRGYCLTNDTFYIRRFIREQGC